MRGKEHIIIAKLGVNSPSEKGQVIQTEKFIVHEGWNAEKQIHDISLIRLKTPIKYAISRNGQYLVNAICLPPDQSDPRPGTFASLAGWGQLSEDSRERAEWLQKISLPIWDRQKCKVNYKEYMGILKTHICAGGRGGEDSCMVII